VSYSSITSVQIKVEKGGVAASLWHSILQTALETSAEVYKAIKFVAFKHITLVLNIICLVKYAAVVQYKG